MRILKTFAAALGLAAAVITGSAAAEFDKRNFTLAHVVGPEFPYHTSAMLMKELLEGASGGNWTLEIHPNGALGGESDALDALLLGTLDFTWVHTAAMANFVPSFDLFNMPFVFHSPAHIQEALDTLDFSKFYEEADAAGFKLLGIGSPAFRYPMNNVKPIESADDFSNLKMRTMGVKAHIDTYESLGSQVVSTSFAELYGALQTGTVDGNENALSALHSMRFNEVQKYLTLVPVVANIAVLAMGKDNFEALTPEQQKLIEEIAAKTVARNNSDYAKLDADALERMKAAGLQVNEVEDLSSFVEATEPVRQKYASNLPEWVQDLMKQIAALPSAAGSKQ